MLVSGNKGYGKSAFVKAYLHRQSMAGKWLAILDPKGEYLDLAARDGLSVLGLRPDGPVRLNPLDAGPALVGERDRRRPGPAHRRGGGPGRVGGRACGVERRALGGDRGAHGARAPRWPSDADAAPRDGPADGPDRRPWRPS